MATESNEPEGVEPQIRTLFEAGEFDKAASLLVASYGDELLRFLLSRLRDHDAAGDAFSQFTEDLWRGFGGFRWQCSARTWSYTLARHAASRYVAAARRQRGREEPLFHATGLHDVAEKIRTQTLLASRTEVKTRVGELSEKLPLDDQTLLVLRVRRGLDWREIARIMSDEDEATTERDIDKHAARLRKRFQSVKEKLRRLVAEAGLAESETERP